MEMNEIMTAIGTLGFPIVACLYMFYYSQKQIDAHKAEMDKVTEAINELKIAIATLCEKIK